MLYNYCSEVLKFENLLNQPHVKQLKSTKLLKYLICENFIHQKYVPIKRHFELFSLFLQRKMTIDDETLYCSEEVLEKILQSKVL